MAKKLVVPGLPQRRFTEKELKDAAADAIEVVAKSKIVQACLAVDITARQLYMTTRGVLERELQEGWDIQNVDLVLQTLIMSAQERANRKFTAIELRQEVLQTIVPFLNILAMQEQEAPVAEPTTSEPASVEPD